MNIIVFQDLKSDTTGSGYANCMYISYLFSHKLISAGVDKELFYMKEYMEEMPFNMKIKTLIIQAKDIEEASYYTEIEQLIKNYNTTKNKSSKTIIAYKLLIKEIEKNFQSSLNLQLESLNHTLGTGTLRKLIDNEIFFLLPPTWVLEDKIEPGYISIYDVLTLQLPELNLENFVLFLNIETRTEIDKQRLSFENNGNKNNPIETYDGDIILPLLQAFSANDLKAARNQLKELTSEFSNKMLEWSALCYQNQTTNIGWNYFEKNIKPLLKK
jgi:hypothetical protein